MKEVIAAELYRAHDLALAGAAQFLIWEVPEVSLIQYTTTKSDHKKGVSRMPNPSKALNLQAPPEEVKARGNRSRTIFAAPNANNSLTLDDFQILKVIGRGSFGKVMLVRKKASGDLFAMKSRRKDALLEREQVEHTRTEKMILEHINHPFLVKLEYAFSTTKDLLRDGLYEGRRVVLPSEGSKDVPRGKSPVLRRSDLSRPGSSARAEHRVPRFEARKHPDG